MALGRVRVALGLDRKKVAGYLADANGIYTAMDTNKTSLPNPNPGLPVLLQQIQDGTAAQQLVTNRVKGAAAARDVKIGILATSLESERMYVQSLCDASPEQAAALTAAASMKVVVVAVRHKPLLAATVGMPSGTVLLVANASLLDSTGRYKTYNWEYTLDGKTFLPAPSTPAARTLIANLPPLAMVGFRVSVTVNKQPQGPWSQVVSILVR